MILKFIFSATLLMAATCFAEGTNTSTVAAVPKPSLWKAQFDSYYYDFKGERPQENGLYEFGNTTLKMQFFSLQYQLSPSWTLMGLAQHYENFVITKVAGFPDSKDRSEGIADTQLIAFHTQFLSPSVLLITDVGLSLPTGSVDKKTPYDPTGRKNYPYNMQMGSGTLDQTAGVTALYLSPKFQLGGRFATILRTSGYNENDYRLGNQFKTDAWIDFPLGASGWTPRVVGYYKHRDAIQGQDSTLSNPFERPFLEYYYHAQINWDVSAAIQYKKAVNSSLSLKAEFGVPMSQETLNYDDVAIYTEYYGTLGVSGSF